MEPIEIFFAAAGLLVTVAGVAVAIPELRHWLVRKWTGTEAPEDKPLPDQPPEPIHHQPITAITAEPPTPEPPPLKVKYLHRQEYINAYYKNDTFNDKASVYREATDWFQQNGNAFQREVANAVREWAGDCFAALTDHYPGTRNDPKTVPYIHLTAWTNIPNGNVIDTANDPTSADACNAVAEDVRKWVHSRFLEQH